MRSHRDWPLLQVWSRQRNLKNWVKAEHLRVARLEPVIVRNAPAAVLDLRFVHNGVGICVPGCIVDMQALQMRVQDAIIWPHTVAHMTKDEDLYEIESLLIDWLRATSSGHGFRSESIRRFGEGDQSFETARYARLLGSVCYSEISQELATAHYAARFAPGKQILHTNALMNVAAILAPSASRTAIVDLDPARHALLNDWFGGEFLSSFTAAYPANLAIIAGDESIAQGNLAADARMIDVTGSMDGEKITFAEANALDDLVRLCERGENVLSTRTLAKASTSQSLLPDAPGPTGGSSGRVLLLLREDGMRAPGSDTDEAYALRSLLQAEGFTVDVTVLPELFDPADYDVVHGFGLLSASAMINAFSRAERANVPTVLTAFFEDVADGGWWGARASRSLLDLAADEQSAGRVLSMLSQRLVYVDSVNAHERFDDGEESARRDLLRTADLVITHSEKERDAVETYAGRSEMIATSLPLVYREHARGSARHLVPDQPYMFVHAPVEARQNVGLVLYAASALDIPCVFAGPILDRRLYRHIAARISTNIVMVPECTAAELEQMAEGAAVYIDAAWVGDGCARIVKSLLHGVVPVVSERRHLDDEIDERVIRVDPASFDSLRNGMSEAWQRAGTQVASDASRAIRTMYDVEAVFKSIVSAYAAAYQHRSALIAS